MKLLLIQAITDNPEGPIFPLGIGYIASVLKDRHLIRAIDMNVEPDPWRVVQEECNHFKPDLIGLSIRNIKVARPGEHLSCIEELQDTIRYIKTHAASAPLVVGGAGFSLFAEKFMKAISEIDFGLLGEGEIALLQFLEQFPDPGGISGILYRQNDKVVSQGLAERPDFSNLPWPRRSLFPIEYYKIYPTSIGVMTKRGCPFRCLHCSDIYLLGPKIRVRTWEDVIAELQYLKRDFAISRFMFADQTFNTPADYTKELLHQMIRANLKMEWTAYFTPKGLDTEMAELLKKSGCSMVNFSPDCCTDTMMEILRKGFTMQDITRAAQLMKKFGIPVTYNFMLGLPGESIKSVLNTLFFTIKQKILLGTLLQLHGMCMVPVRIYPHTQLQDIAVKEQLIEKDHDLTRPTFYRPKNKALHFFDRSILASLSFLWKLKHMKRR